MRAYKCDCCKQYVDEAFPLYLSGFCTLKGEYVGRTEGYATGKIDVCKSCLEKIESAVDSLLEKI